MLHDFWQVLLVHLHSLFLLVDLSVLNCLSLGLPCHLHLKWSLPVGHEFLCLPGFYLLVLQLLPSDHLLHFLPILLHDPECVLFDLEMPEQAFLAKIAKIGYVGKTQVSYLWRNLLACWKGCQYGMVYVWSLILGVKCSRETGSVGLLERIGLVLREKVPPIDHCLLWVCCQHHSRLPFHWWLTLHRRRETRLVLSRVYLLQLGDKEVLADLVLRGLSRCVKVCRLGRDAADWFKFARCWKSESFLGLCHYTLT